MFIHSYQDDTGNEPTGAVKLVAARIEEIDRMGLHCCPQVRPVTTMTLGIQLDMN